MAFATETELESFTGSSIDTPRAELLLDLASAAVADEVGIDIEAGTSTDKILDAEGAPTLVLPEWPVTAVDSVTIIEADGDETLLRGPSDPDPEYRWSRSGVLYRVGGCWPNRPRSVKITYDHGFATIPTGIKRVTLLAAARGLTSPTGYTSETIGDWSGTRSAEGGVALELTALEASMAHAALRR